MARHRSSLPDLDRELNLDRLDFNAMMQQRDHRHPDRWSRVYFRAICLSRLSLPIQVRAVGEYGIVVYEQSRRLVIRLFQDPNPYDLLMGVKQAWVEKYRQTGEICRLRLRTLDPASSNEVIFDCAKEWNRDTQDWNELSTYEQSDRRVTLFPVCALAPPLRPPPQLLITWPWISSANPYQMVPLHELPQQQQVLLLNEWHNYTRQQSQQQGQLNNQLQLCSPQPSPEQLDPEKYRRYEETINTRDYSYQKALDTTTHFFDQQTTQNQQASPDQAQEHGRDRGSGSGKGRRRGSKRGTGSGGRGGLEDGPGQHPQTPQQVPQPNQRDQRTPRGGHRGDGQGGRGQGRGGWGDHYTYTGQGNRGSRGDRGNRGNRGGDRGGYKDVGFGSPGNRGGWNARDDDCDDRDDSGRRVDPSSRGGGSHDGGGRGRGRDNRGRDRGWGRRSRKLENGDKDKGGK
ncbi:uncharacterized protein F4822DRAFT_425803 [Hypoxylon trugodes]|uniref:uncharacterized protein n=1 Tax=Hypoxylon trugodes TaxID=326681 RepID=UPI00219DE81A|nr:uncharacterized protein F4822DRAFT_425803 [Hypoxylon trugodes]KAI1392601.1 hypothetical protein F4822DRAFT_425803 [Hypoxylon trugodes]